MTGSLMEEEKAGKKWGGVVLLAVMPQLRGPQGTAEPVKFLSHHTAFDCTRMES